MRGQSALQCLFLTVACAAGWMSSPLRAQEDPAAPLDALISESTDAASALALARRQAAADDLLAALATLERAQVDDRDNADLRLLHASLLCRLDDAAGARVELDQLGAHAISEPAWAEVTAACGPVPRPAPPAAPGPGGPSLDKPTGEGRANRRTAG